MFVSIEKIYQTLETVFHRLSKHLEFHQKYSAARRIFNSLLGVWISRWNTVSRVWYITSTLVSYQCTCSAAGNVLDWTKSTGTWVAKVLLYGLNVFCFYLRRIMNIVRRVFKLVLSHKQPGKNWRCLESSVSLLFIPARQIVKAE